MKSAVSYRVAVSGGSTLLGRELISVLGQRNFPVSRLVTLGSDDEEPESPILDLDRAYEDTVATEDISSAELDFAFLAVRPSSGALPSFLREPALASGECTVIDLADALPEMPGKGLSIPFLERNRSLHRVSSANPTARLLVSPHPATIMMSAVLLRLHARFPITSVVAQIFVPASETGASAIEELQKQTINLLSFQKIPSAVFGAQMAFNLLPRLGLTGHAPSGLETRLRSELRTCLGKALPLPALRVIHVPVFHSLGVSLYAETREAAFAETLRQALEGERVRVRRASQHAPSQVEAAGSSDILVDAIMADPDHSTAVWIWAVTDNLALAALNAVEIAESVKNSPEG